MKQMICRYISPKYIHAKHKPLSHRGGGDSASIQEDGTKNQQVIAIIPKQDNTCPGSELLHTQEK